MYRWFLVTVMMCLLTLVGYSQKAPVNVILDTDIAGDYDDVGAMAVLHNLADRRQVNILAVMSCNVFPTTVPVISVLNEYFGRPDIPIGVTKGTFPNMECPQKWAEALIEKYPHKVRSNEMAEDAVLLYRRILAAQEDETVTIISVGFFTNLANLLESGADRYSTLTGKELVRRKVKRLVSMAAQLEPGKTSGREYNVYVDVRSSKAVIDNWPTPLLLSGFEIGEKILTGIRLINNDSIKNSPVKDAYMIALAADNNSTGRMSWDQTAVLAGIRGLRPHFKERKLDFEIRADGTNVLVAGKRLGYLQFRRKPQKIAAVIEQLMME